MQADKKDNNKILLRLMSNLHNNWTTVFLSTFKCMYQLTMHV